MSTPKAEESAIVSLRATPSEGYALSALMIVDEEGNTYEVTQGAKPAVEDAEDSDEVSAQDSDEDAYHFTMPAQDVTVSAQFDSLSYEVVFNANGGTGTMQNQTIAFGESKELA